MSNEVEISVVTQGEQKSSAALKGVQQDGTKAAESINSIGTTARGILSADIIGQIGEAAKSAFTSSRDAATDLGESLNAVNRIFGEGADAVNKWGEEQANSFGLSQRAFNQMAVPIGASLKNVGLEMNNVARLTLMLTERAADMGSVFNQDVAMVLEDIQAGLRGEADPLEKYGVGLSAAAVQQRALADTGKDSAAALTDQEIMLARVNVLMDQTRSTMGDFKDTSDEYANAQRIANAEIEEAQAKLGQAFLPVLAEVAKVVGTIAEGFGNLPGPVQTTTAVVLGLGAAFLFLAPKLVAAVDAFQEMRTHIPDADSKMGKMAVTAGKAAGVIAALAIAGQIAGNVFGTQLNPQVDALANNLEKLGKEGEISGEAARVLGKDAEQLKRALVLLHDDGLADIPDATAEAVEQFLGLSDVMGDSSFGQARERIAAVDAAMAKLVDDGKTEEAAAAFKVLSEWAKESGTTNDELIAGLPQYAAAQEKANVKTTEAKTQIQGQVVALKDLHDALRAQSDPLFALIDAQTNLREKQEELNEAISKHGNDSREAEEAMRNLGKAGIELAGAVSDAQGKFDGKLTPAMKAALQAAGLTEGQIKSLEQGFRNATAAGDAFAKNYNATVTVTYREKGRAVPVSDNFQSGIGGRQSGGYGSGWIVAGEHGIPELINLGASGRVYNGVESRGKAAELAQGTGMLGGMGGMGPMSIDLNLNINGAEREFVTFFKKIIDTEGGGDVTNLNTN